MDEEVERLRRVLQALLTRVAESTALIRNLAVDAFSPFPLVEIQSMNCALLNIEELATDLEHDALACEAALVPECEPEADDDLSADDIPPWPPLDAVYFDSDSSSYASDTASYSD
jgi:hypothetical protein